MNSKSTILTVIVFLGLVALATVVGGFVLAYNGQSIPAELVGLGGTALGAVGGILAKTGTEPMPVAIAAPAELVTHQAEQPPLDVGPLQERLANAANDLLSVASSLGYTPPDASAAPTASEVPVQAG